MNQAETQFIHKMDLQLFNDGSASAPDTTPTPEPSTPEPNAPAATKQDSQEIDYSEFGKSNTDDQLALLKRHGFYGTREPENQEPNQPQPGQQQPDAQTSTEGQAGTQPPAPAPEDPEVELKVNGEVKKVKQSELTKYAQMGFDYTQKTQDLAAQRRQLDAMLAAQVQSQPQQPSNPLKQTEQEYQAVASQVERELGLQPGEYSPYDPIHQFAFNRVMTSYNSQKLAQQAVETRVNTFFQQAQQDPKAAEIDANFDAYIYKMGAEGAEGAKKANAILLAKQRLFNRSASMDDLTLLESHWNAVKTALTTPVTPPKAQPVQQPKPIVQPPKTETPGSSTEPPKVRMDYKKLGGMKQSDQLQYLKDAGYFKRQKG